MIGGAVVGGLVAKHDLAHRLFTIAVGIEQRVD
jgi:hypothetical protein